MTEKMAQAITKKLQYIEKTIAISSSLAPPPKKKLK